MIVTKINANKLCKPAGLNKDDTSSRRISEDVAEQMDNNAHGMTEIETGPGDTLESIAKGSLQGTGQKVDLGSMLFEQDKIVTENYDQIKGRMTDQGQDPKDFKYFKGRELPQGMKIKLSTPHTQHSNTPTFGADRQEDSIAQSRNKYSDTEEQYNQLDPIGQMNNDKGNNFYAGAGSISDTQYALDMNNVGLSDEARQGIAKFMIKNKK